MVVTGAVLFLIGTFNSFTKVNGLETTEIIVEKHINPAYAEKLTNYGLQSGFPPFISNFMQHGTNVFFKPQFMLFPPYLEDCKKWPMITAIPFAAQPQFAMEEPVKIVETVVSDGEPAVVDQIVAIKPSIPLTELQERPMFISSLPKPAEYLPVSSPVAFSDTSVIPPIPLVPVQVTNISENSITDSIPAAPELPQLEIPQTPVSSPVAFSDTSVIPPIPLVPVQVTNISENSITDSIPAAPELPQLEIPQTPVELNEPVEAFLLEVKQPTVTEGIKPIPILETSELPTLPSHETLGTIPAAPELPALEIPQLPVVLHEPVEVPMVEVSQLPIIEGTKPDLVSETSKIPSPPVLDMLLPESKPEPAPYIEVYENYIPLHIPEAPRLPPYSPPPLPVPIILHESIRECDNKPTSVVSEPIGYPDASVLPKVPGNDFLSVNQPENEKIEQIFVPQPAALPSAAVTLAEMVTSQKPTIIEEVNPAETTAIPNPPELPYTSISELPISVAVSEPLAPEVPLLVEPQPALIEKPVPAPPVIPSIVPIEFPEVTALPAIHDAPVIIAETSPLEPEIITNEIHHAEISEHIPVAVSEAPILPPAPKIPLPAVIKEVSETNKETELVAKPLVLPPAPELPPLSFQPLPIPLEEPVMSVYPSAESTPVFVQEQKLPQLEIPNAPLYVYSSPMAPAPLPFVISQKVEATDKIASPALSKIKSIISFPTACVKNIVIERVLPNIVREGVEEIPSSLPNYPVISPFSSTIGIRLF